MGLGRDAHHHFLALALAVPCLLAPHLCVLGCLFFCPIFHHSCEVPGIQG